MTPIEKCPEIYQKLAGHVLRLGSLLSQPEPGLWSWSNCVAEEVGAIAALHSLDGDLFEALRASVQLQAHYAKLLNQYDGGQRIVFESAEQWLARLKELEQARKGGRV